jgi:tellurite resistance protein TerC
VTPSIGTPGLWAGFIGLVLLFLAADLGIFHRKDEPISTRNALTWTGVWVALSLCFNVAVGHWFGGDRAAEFLTGYLIEKSLSVDNLFVFLVIFSTLAIPPRYQHRVLFWGILTALALRAAMILAGTALLARFHWLIYVFGGFLGLTGLKLLLADQAEVPHPERSALFRLVRRAIPTTSRMDGHQFMVRVGGRWLATPLLLALVLIEVSDVVFALDSIPAIFGITLDPFIVFTSNIFAILGLRSLYFAISSAIDRFSRLRQGLALVLIFIGAKMLVAPWFPVGQGASLGVVAGLLGGALVASGIWPALGKPADREH